MPKPTGEYTLIYWNGLPGRGEFVRLALEYAGQEYKQDLETKSVVACLRQPKNTGWPPHFAPPILQLPSGKQISQTPNILSYLGWKLGMNGSDGLTDEDEIETRRAHVNQIVLTAMDLNTEAHDVHHPVGIGLYYEDQIPESKRRAEEFRRDRITKYLGVFELALKSNEEGGEEGYLAGKKTTVADIAVFHVLCGLEHAFPIRMKVLSKDSAYEHVFKLKKRMGNEPNIAKYLASERRQAFGMGIFRHYPELDGEK